MTFLAHRAWRLGLFLFLASTPWLLATPANKAALERDFDRFLPKWGTIPSTPSWPPSEAREG